MRNMRSRITYIVITLRPCSAGGRRLKRLEKGEPGGVHPDLVHQCQEPGRRVAVKRHLVVVRELGEHGLPGFADIQCVLNQSIRIHIGFADLALGPVLLRNQS